VPSRRPLASWQWQDVAVTSALPTVSRRRVLVGAAALALIGTTAAGCGSPAPHPDVEALQAQLERAQADSRLAAAAATAALPQVAPALNTVAAERAAHAQALTDEITRILAQAPSTSTTPSAATTTSAAAAKPPTTKDVIAALEQSADSAAQLAVTQSGYRAGLLGSIAASCSAAQTVGLADRTPA
jgi:hypothetical protein